MDTTTAKGNEMTQNISDGRSIKVEAGNGEHAVVMVQTSGTESVICYISGPVAAATTEAARIAKGIEADLNWTRVTDAGIRARREAFRQS